MIPLPLHTHTHTHTHTSNNRLVMDDMKKSECVCVQCLSCPLYFIEEEEQT